MEIPPEDEPETIQFNDPTTEDEPETIKLNGIPSEDEQETPQQLLWRRAWLFVIVYWKSVVVIVSPIALLPIVIIGTGAAMTCFYVICLMAVYWISEAIPIAITSLLPVIIFPVLHIMGSGPTSAAYISDFSVSLLGTYIFGQALEYSMLDQRIALIIIKTVGCRPSHLLAILISGTFLISMWMTNLAVLAVVCPIVKAILTELDKHGLCRRFQEGYNEKTPRPSKTALCFYFSVSHASIFGGCSTLYGTTANTIMVDMFKSEYGLELRFLDFTAYAFPVMVLLLVLSTIYLQWLYMGLFRAEEYQRRSSVCIITDEEVLEATQEMVLKEYAELEPVMFHEIFIASLLVILVILIATLRPGYFVGWGSAFFEKDVTEASVATLSLILLMAFPSHMSFLNYFKKESDYLPQRRSRGALSWYYVRAKVPWRMIFLMGGSRALALGSRETKLTNGIIGYIHSMKDMPNMLMSFLSCLPVLILTQVFGNAPLARTILPVISEMAICHDVHPTYLMIPVGLMCTFTFTTAVGAGVNALVVGYANIRAVDVAQSGCVPALISFLLVWLSFPTYGSLMFSNQYDLVGHNSTWCHWERK